MKNVIKAIEAFNDLMTNPEKPVEVNASLAVEEKNSNRIHPPAPAPPPLPPLPVLKDFNNVAFMGIHESAEDDDIKKMEELRMILMKSMSLINQAADVTVRKTNSLKTNEAVWIGLTNLPLLRATETENISFSQTAKSLDIAGQIINIIKGFKPKEDRELIRFNEFLGKIARSYKPIKNFFSEPDHTLLIFTYSVNSIKKDSVTTYLPKIKQFRINFNNNNLAGVRCENNSDINVNLTLICTNYVLDYEASDKETKDAFLNMINRYDHSQLQQDPTNFEGNFKRA